MVIVCDSRKAAFVAYEVYGHTFPFIYPNVLWCPGSALWSYTPNSHGPGGLLIPLAPSMCCG